MMASLISKFDKWLLSGIDFGRIDNTEYGLVQTKVHKLLIQFTDGSEIIDKVTIVDYPYWHWFYNMQINMDIHEVMRAVEKNGIRTQNRIYPSHSIKYIELLPDVEIVQSVWLKREQDL